MDSPRPFRWSYLVALLIGFLLPLAVLLAVGRTDWFLQHTKYGGLAVAGYGSSLRGANCAILIYGDSSALTGLDPRIVQRRTGMKTCNISEGTTIEEVVGTDLPLQRYLAHNAPPRVLLTSWTPTILFPHQAPLRAFALEGVWYAWRFRAWRPMLTWKGMDWTMQYINWEWTNLLTALLPGGRGRGAPRHDFRAERAQHLGQYTYPEPPQTRCTKAYYTVDAIRDAPSVAEFRRRYNTSTTHVVVDVTPVPTCAPLFALYQTTLQGLTDNALERYPIQDFNDGDVHLSPAGTARYSEEAAAQVLALLKTSGQ